MDTNNIVLLAVSLICLGVAVYLTLKAKKAEVGDPDTADKVFTYITAITVAIQSVVDNLVDISRDKFNTDEEYRKKLVELAVEATYNVLDGRVTLSQEAAAELATRLLEIIIDKVEAVNAKEAEVIALSEELDKVAK